jgi:aminoglycoside phosphotransferase family enzyme
MEFSGDREVMKVLNFYKAYYAWVRGKVTAFRLLEGTDSKEKKDVKSASISYLELSMKYMKELNNVQ